MNKINTEIVGYKVTGSFRFWCQHVLPLVYDDSLSYYELLCKVVTYLNDVINNVDALKDSTVGLLESFNDVVDEFNTLQQFVNNYFDNLDVQDEINHKLDEMAENGELLKVISPYLPFVTPEMFGAVGDGETDDTNPVQECLNSRNKLICFKPNTIYNVRKGETNEAFPDNDQPCLYLTGNDIVIEGNNATLRCNYHGQGVMEIMRGNNIKISNLKFQGYGEFPPIGPLGYCEKSIASDGYYKAGYNWEDHKNNSVDTSRFTGVNGDTSIEWGTFGNGFIGNAGIGLLIHNYSENIIVENCYASGFNFNGFSVGFRGHSDYAHSRHIIFRNCHVENIYDCGFNMLLCKDVTVENCTVENIGHPSARPVNENSTYAYQYADPGYGIACRAPLSADTKATNVTLINNTISKCVRKGIDSHGANGLIAKNNKIKLCYVAGVEMAGSDIESRLSRDVIIDSNLIEYCGGLGHAINQYIYTGNQSYDVNAIEPNIIIANNIIKNCSANNFGILYARAGINTSIINNIISGLWDIYAEQVRYCEAIRIGQDDQPIRNIKVSNNSISINSNKLYMIIRASNSDKCVITNNTAHVLNCVAPILIDGTSRNVILVGNSLIAENYDVAPATVKTQTGISWDNIISGSKRGNKYYNIENVTLTNSAFRIDDDFIDANTICTITPKYIYGTPLNLIVTAQTVEGHANVYIRDGDGNLIPDDTPVSFNLLLHNE